MRLKLVPVAVALALACGQAVAGPVLRVLAWPGYAEPEVVRDFEGRGWTWREA
mgnify:CR=1 FL=1